jgi:hypothetical protein
VEFKTALSLNRHLTIIHHITDKAVLKEHTYVRTRSYPPQRCSYAGCENATEYKQKTKLIIHLEKAHGVTKEDASDYITLK